MGPQQDSRLIECIPSSGDYGMTILIGMIIGSLFLLKRQPTEFRFLWLIAGQTIILTAPTLLTGADCVWGDYPTIDKEGSLLYYQQKIHIEQLFDPIKALDNPAIQLIGFHLGHLWVTEFFDLFLPTYAAYNAQALFNVILSWWCMWLVLWEKNKQPWLAMIIAFGFGMGLHLFRDINWYTIEKSAVWWLPLFWWSIERVRTGKNRVWLPAIIFFGAAYTNLYWGMLIAMLGLGLGLIHRNRKIFFALAGCCLVGMAIGCYQAVLMRNSPALAQPDDFIWLRAALDSFTIYPLQWNRIPFFLAVHPICLAICLWSIFSKKTCLWTLSLGLLFFVLSLGPWLLPDTFKNPVYLIFSYLPGMWRFSEPEIFFHLTWMLLLGSTREFHFKNNHKIILYVIIVGYWAFVVRPSKPYPAFTKFIPSNLSTNWQQKVFQSDPPL